MAKRTITLTASGMERPLTAIYYDTATESFYADSDETIGILSLADYLPTKAQFTFDGFFSGSTSANRGTPYIESDGTFTTDFYDKAASATGNFQIYGYATLFSYAVKFFRYNESISTTPLVTLYTPAADGDLAADGARRYYSTWQCDGEEVSEVIKPFNGASSIFRGYGNAAHSTFYTSSCGADSSTVDLGDLRSLANSAFTSENSTSIGVWGAWRSLTQISITANGGAGAEIKFYFDSVNDAVYLGNDTTAGSVTSVPVLARMCYSLDGYYNTSSGSDCIVNSAGVVDIEKLSNLVNQSTTTKTIVARWTQVSYKLEFSLGTGVKSGTRAIYYKIGEDRSTVDAWFLDDQCTLNVYYDGENHRIDVPTKDGYIFRGVWSKSSPTTSGSRHYVNFDGALDYDELSYYTTPTSGISTKAYGQWDTVYTVTLDDNDGAGGEGNLYYSTGQNTGWYSDPAATVEHDVVVAVPQRECHRFDGYYTAKTGGTQRIEADGRFTYEFDSGISSNTKLYARWTRISYKLGLDDNGGEGGSGAVYSDGATAGEFYFDWFLTNDCEGEVSVPTRPGYDFAGYYTEKTGGSKYIDDGGGIILAVAIADDTPLYAHWTPHVFTLTFDAMGGTGDAQPMQAAYLAPIGQTLPTVVKDGWKFAGWYIDNTRLSPSTRWNWPSDREAAAAWMPQTSQYFGNVEDYFGLSSIAMVAVESSSGDMWQHVSVTQSGKASNNQSGSQTSAKQWRNPSVTYKVMRPTTINVTLGKAFGGSSGSTGYMITGVEVRTAAGQLPTITVTGTANEGVDAINLFPVSISISPRSKAQNLMGAVSGGGNLVSLSLRASCDPVVVVEDLLPVASDVVHGVVEVSAETVATGGESAPGAGSGFTLTALPVSKGEASYVRHQVTVRKEL